MHHGRQRTLGGAAGPAAHGGHTEGEENIARLVRVAVTRNIGWLTVFGFSTENWVRPRTEVRHILGLHRKLFARVDELNELNVRIQWIGRPFDFRGPRTPKYVQRAIRKAIADTGQNTGMVLTVAFDYGSRAELVARRRGASAPPAVDHAGRRSRSTCTSPSSRRSTCSCARAASGAISNFMLWQIAGAPVYFTERTWPEFDGAELDAAIALVA